MRYLAYALGVAEKNVGWDKRTKAVTLKLDNVMLKLAIGRKAFCITVGDKILHTDTLPRQMDVAPMILNGRAFVPARFVAEAVGMKWAGMPGVKPF